jgi:hypothetical protein
MQLTASLTLARLAYALLARRFFAPVEQTSRLLGSISLGRFQLQD